jgi:hypothetical protein
MPLVMIPSRAIVSANQHSLVVHIAGAQTHLHFSGVFNCVVRCQDDPVWPHGYTRANRGKPSRTFARQHENGGRADARHHFGVAGNLLGGGSAET